MNIENIPVITDREKLYDKCENMEQLFDNYYLPLLDKHYSKTYELQQENQSLKKQVDYLKRSIERKEETIIELEQERVPYENEYVEELKKQLEEYKYSHSCSFVDTCKNVTIANYNQQKEFIKYLEDEISKWHYNYDSNTYEYELEEPPAEELLVSALSKYKEIIGGK